jgi:hypothetical protein
MVPEIKVNQVELLKFKMLPSWTKNSLLNFLLWYCYKF